MTKPPLCPSCSHREFRRVDTATAHFAGWFCVKVDACVDRARTVCDKYLKAGI